MTARFAAVDAAASALVASGEFPSVAAAVVENGAVVHAVGIEAETDTVYLTASISKVFTAVVCLRAAELGFIDLDADLAEVRLPDAARMCGGARDGGILEATATAIRAAVRGRGVTVTPRRLLTHTSGLCDDEEALMPGPYRTEGGDHPLPLGAYVAGRLAPAEALDASTLQTLGLSARPAGAGKDHEAEGPWSATPVDPPYHYSNAGITLLGAALEVATGRPLADLCEEWIFAPAGMRRTGFTLAGARAAVGGEGLAVPHRGREVIAHYGVAEWPAAGLRSTAADLAEFLSALTAGPGPGGGETPRLLAPASLAAMLPADGRAGLAWWGHDATYSSRVPGLWEHGGFMDGVRTHIYLLPSRGSGAVLLTNGTGSYEPLQAAIMDALRA